MKQFPNPTTYSAAAGVSQMFCSATLFAVVFVPEAILSWNQLAMQKKEDPHLLTSQMLQFVFIFRKIFALPASIMRLENIPR